MAEDITDLTEDEESEGKPKKAPKPKKEKAPKEPKVKAAKPDKKDKGDQKGGKIWSVLIIVLIVVVLVTAFCALVYFNIFGLGDIVLDPVTEWLLSLIVWIEPAFSTVEGELYAEHEVRSALLDERERELEAQEEELKERIDATDTRETQLDRRSEALDRREAALDLREDREIPLFRRTLTEDELADLQALSATFTQMAPEVAAGILTELYDQMDAASILYHMQARNRASILAVMETELAVAITDILLYS